MLEDDGVTLDDLRTVLGEQRFTGLVGQVKRRKAQETLASLESSCTEWARSIIEAGQATTDDLRAIFRYVDTDDQTGEIYVRARPLRLQAAASTRGAAPAGRLKRLDRTQERDFRLPILGALNELGGRARVDEVLELVERKMQPKLRPDDHEPLPKTGQLRWRNTAEYERKKMVLMQPPLLNSGSQHGWWEITDAGREYLRQHRP